MTSMTRRLLLVVVAMAVAMVAATTATMAMAPAASAASSALSVDDQVREAVFKHLFKQNASGMKERAAFYFLSLGDSDKPQDPSPALMARFAEHRPRVEPVSRARISVEEGIRHRETGEKGIVFRVTAIKRVSDDVMEVEGGYHEGTLSASGNVFRVERKNGVWVVTDDKMQWIA